MVGKQKSQKKSSLSMWHFLYDSVQTARYPYIIFTVYVYKFSCYISDDQVAKHFCLLVKQKKLVKKDFSFFTLISFHWV